MMVMLARWMGKHLISVTKRFLTAAGVGEQRACGERARVVGPERQHQRACRVLDGYAQPQRGLSLPSPTNAYAHLPACSILPSLSPPCPYPFFSSRQPRRQIFQKEAHLS